MRRPDVLSRTPCPSLLLSSQNPSLFLSGSQSTPMVDSIFKALQAGWLKPKNSQMAQLPHFPGKNALEKHQIERRELSLLWEKYSLRTVSTIQATTKRTVSAKYCDQIFNIGCYQERMMILKNCCYAMITV